MRRRQQKGLTYLALLFAVAMAGIALAGAGTLWAFERQREREAELLFIGNQFRQAIRLYYERSPGRVKRYPMSLNDLLQDNRFLGIERRLRQIYADPFTREQDWGLVAAPEGGIMGVYSLSTEHPIKSSGFPARDVDFDGKKKYSDWRFIYRPPAVLTK
jgi:type II secretory pathway pseudopilin PulG